MVVQLCKHIRLRGFFSLVFKEYGAHKTYSPFVLLRLFINTSRKPIAPENATSETSSPHCGLCCMRLSISTPLLGNITVVVD